MQVNKTNQGRDQSPLYASTCHPNTMTMRHAVVALRSVPLRFSCFLLTALIAFQACCVDEARAQFTLTTGAFTNTNFSTNTNWTSVITPTTSDPTVTLTFGGSSSLTAATTRTVNNDLIDLWANVITFTKTATTNTTPSYTITGNAITMTSNGGSGPLIQLLGGGTGISTITYNTSILLGSGSLTIASNVTTSGRFQFNGAITNTSGNAGVLTLTGSSTQANTIAGNITDTITSTLSIFKGGTGTWVLSGVNTFAGDITAQAGTLRFTNSNALSSGPGVLSLNGGTISLSLSGATNLTKEIVVNGIGTLASDSTLSTGIVNVNSAIRTNTTGLALFTISGSSTTGAVNNLNSTLTNGMASGLGVIKGGASTWAITNSNNLFTGGVTIAGGALQTSADGSMFGAINFANNNLTLSGGVLEAAGTLTTNLGTGVGQISMTAGNGGFSAFGGPLIVSLNNGASLTWGSAASGFLVNNGALLFGSLTANDVVTLSNHIALGGVTRTISIANNTFSAADSAVIAGNLTGTAAGLSIIGTGTLSLLGSNSFSGLSTLGGTTTVIISDSNSLGSGTISFTGGTLINNFVGSLSNTITLPGNAVLTGTQTLTLGGAVTTPQRSTSPTITVNNSAGVVFTNNFAVSTSTVGLALTFGGTGPVTLQGTLSALTASNSGLSITNTSALGVTLLANQTFAAATTVGAGARLNFGDGTGNTGNLSQTLSIAATGRAVFRYLDITTFGLTNTANIIGAGGIEVNSTLTGGLTLTRTNTFTGGVTITQGTLRIGTATALPVTNTVAINSTGTLDLNGNSQGITTLSNIAGTGGIITSGVAGAVVLTLSGGEFSGVIENGSGTLGVQKVGAGSLTLNAANTFSDLSTLAAGTLVLGNNQALGTGSWNVTGGTFSAGGAAITATNDVNLLGNLVIGGTAALAMNGTFVNTGATTRTLTVNTTAGFSMGGNLLLTNTAGAGVLDIAGTGPINISGGVISDGTGTGALGIFNTGGVRLSGTNTYSGGTTLGTNGVLIIANNQALGSGTLFVAGVGTIRSDDTLRTTTNNVMLFSNLIAGGTSALAMNGTFINTGATTRTITVNTTAGFSIGGALLTDTAGAGILNIAGTGPVTLGGVGVISDGTGTGALNLFNTGGVTVAGQNIYTGGTTVNNGVTLIIGSSSTATDGPLGTGVVSLIGTTIAIQGAGATQTVSNDFFINNAAPNTVAFNGTQQLVFTGTFTNLSNTQRSLTLSNSAGVTINNYVINGTTSNANNLVILGNQSLTLGVLSNGPTVTTGNLVMNGGTVYLVGASTYNGVTNISATANLNIGGGGTTGDVGAGTVTTTGRLIYNRSNAYTQRGVVAGPGNVLFTAGGVYTMSGVNTWAGGSTINAGSTVILGNNAALGTGAVNISGSATLQADATARTIPNVVNLLGDLTLSGATSFTINGLVTQSGGDRTIFVGNTGVTTVSNINLVEPAFTDTRTLTVAGTGTLVVNGSISSAAGTGNLLVTGNLALNNTNNFTGAITVDGSGRLQIGNGAATGALVNAVTLSSASSVLAFNRTGAHTYTGAVSGAGGVSFIGATGAVLFGNSGSTYSGFTSLQTGSLILADNNALGTSTLYVTGPSTLQSDAVGSRAISNAVMLTAGLTLGGTQYLNLNGTIAGASGLTVASGTHSLFGTNVYAGGTTLTAGTLVLSNNQAVGTGTLTLNGGVLSGTGSLVTLTNAVNAAALVIGGSTNITLSTLIQGVGATRTFTVSNTGTTILRDISISTVSNTQTFTLFAGPGADLIIAGQITRTIGGGGTTVTTANLTLTGGAGSIRLQSANFYNGATNIGGDVTVVLEGGASRINGTGTITMTNNAVLSLSSVNQTLSSFIGSGSNTIIGSGGTSSLITVSGGTFGGVVAGNLGLTKVSAGVLTLSGNNTSTGAIIISAGTLNIGSGGSSGSVQAPTIANAATLVFNRTGASTYSGVISGAGTVTFTGGGQYNITGTNSWTGATTIGNNTTLTVGAASIIGNGAVSVLNGATLAVSGSIGTGAVSLGNGSVLTGSGGRLSGIVTAGLGSDIIIGTAGGSVATLTLGGLVLNGGSLNFDLDNLGSGDLLRVLTLPTINLATNININNLGGLTTGSYLLLTGYAGTISNTGFLSVSAPSGFSTSLNNQTGNLYLEFAGVAQKLWTGSENNLWDVGTTTNWTLTGSITPTVYNNGDSVIFTDAGLNTNITISNGGLGVVPSGVLVVDTTNSYSFSGEGIGGANGLNKQGIGTLTLLNNNTFTGGIVIGGGTLQLGDGSLTDSGSITPTVSIQMDNNSLLAINRIGTISLSNNITGSGNLSKSGSGTLILSGNSNYQGNTTVFGGTLVVTTNTSLPNGVGSVVTVSGGNLNIATGAGILTLTTVVVSGSNSQIAVTSGGLIVASSLTNNGGTIRTGGGSLQSTLTLNNTGTINIVNGNATLATLNMFDGQLNVTGSSVTVTTINLGGNGLAGTLPTINIGTSTTVNLLSTMNFNSSDPNNSALITGSGVLNFGALRNVTVADSANVGNDLTIEANLSALTTFTKLGAGTLYLKGSSLATTTNYLAAGTLALGGDGVLGTGTLAITTGTIRSDASARTINNVILQNGILNIAGTTTSTLTLAQLRASAATTLNVVNGAKTIINSYLLNTAANTAVSQTITGSGEVDFLLLTAGTGTGAENLIFNGTGTYNLLGANTTLSGAMSVRNGTVIVKNSGAFGTGTATLGLAGAGSQIASLLLGSTDGTSGLQVNTDVSVLSSTGAATSLVLGGLYAETTTFGGNVLMSNINTFLRAETNGAVYFNGIMSGTGGITKTGGGTVVLAGSNTYTGTTTVAAGTLQAGSATAFNSGANLRVNLGATIDLNGFGFTLTTLNNGAGGGGNITNGGLSGITLTVGSGAFGGVIQDGTNPISLIKNTSGTLTLSGSNTYSGATSILAGVLQIGSGGTSGSIASLLVANEGILAFNRSDDSTYGGVISGGGSLLKQGAGRLTLTADHLFTGAVTIAGGTLQLGDGNTSGSLVSTTIVNNAAFAFNRSDDFTYGTQITGTGMVAHIGTGTITFTNNQLYTGGTAIGSLATLQLGNNTTSGSVIGSILNDGRLVFNRSDNYTSSNSITGIGSVAQVGSGILTFISNQTYTGVTTIAGGATLQLGNGGTAGALTGPIANAGLLIVNRSDAVTLTGNISGTGDLSKSGSGTLTLLGNNNYSGKTTIVGGTLQLVDNFAGSGIDVGGNLLQFNTTGSQIVAGGINGLGFIQKLGSGTTELTGTNAFSGITSVDAGTLIVNQALTGTVFVNAGGSYTGAGSGAGLLNISGGSGTITGTQSGGINLSAGSLNVASGGVTTGTINISGGSLVALSGASVGNTLGISVSSGTFTVNSGATVVGSGQTTVGTGGTVVGNGAVNGMVVVQNGGTLKGVGTIGAVEIQVGGTLSQGQSVGQLTIDGSGVVGGPSLALDGGADVLFEFRDALGAPGTGWDFVDLGAGFLDLTGASTSNKINLDIVSWLPNNSGPGAAANFNLSVANTYEWLFVKTIDTNNATALLGATPSTINDYFAIDDTGVFPSPFSRPQGPGNVPATFVVEWKNGGQGNGLYITFTAVPEPGSMILAGLASLGAGWYGRRRKRREAAAQAATTVSNEQV